MGASVRIMVKLVPTIPKLNPLIVSKNTMLTPTNQRIVISCDGEDLVILDKDLLTGQLNLFTLYKTVDVIDIFSESEVKH